MIWRVEISNFTIEPDLIGAKIPLGSHEGYRIRLELPTDVDESLTGRGKWRPDAAVQVTGADLEGTPTVVTVRRAVVRAYFATDLDYLATLPADYSPGMQSLEEVQRIRAEATAVVDRVVGAFFDLVAVSSQMPAITLNERPSVTLNALFVGKQRTRVRFGTAAESINVIMGARGVGKDVLFKAGRRTAVGGEASLAWRLYLEAHRRLFIGDDPRPALAEAYSAAEVGIKEALRRKGRGSKQVELLARASRLKELLTDVAEAVLGKGYAAAQKENYDRILELVAQRNDMVHRGTPPNREKLAEEVRAVRALLQWLDAVAGQRRGRLDET
jgi:hypothetical protein